MGVCVALGNLHGCKVPENVRNAVQTERKNAAKNAEHDKTKNAVGQYQFSYPSDSGETIDAMESGLYDSLKDSPNLKIVKEYLNKTRQLIPAENRTQYAKHVIDVVKEQCEGPQAPLLAAHPDLIFSNRMAFFYTGEFVQGENVGNYCVVDSLPVGTIGRSFLVTTGNDDSVTENLSVFKVVSFTMRMGDVENVLGDHRVLSNLNHKNVVRCLDVLDDGSHENMIFVTPYSENGSIESYAGKLENDPEKLRRIIYELGAAIRILHSHMVYHYNLKLDNVLLTKNGTACIADAGFWRLFASQTPEALVFNGELACMPPEMFLNRSENEIDPAKVDMWGFGILVYRLAYGMDPFEIEGRTFDEVREMVLHHDILFSPRSWPFEKELQEVILSCLSRDPVDRPLMIRLLRHSFFRKCTPWNMSTANASLNASFATGIARNSKTRFMNLSISNIAPNGRTSLIHLRNGITVDHIIGQGRRSQTLLAHLRRNPSKVFVLRTFQESILQKLDTCPNEGQKILRNLTFCVKCRHPNIISLHEIVYNKDGCFLTRDYVDGESLGSSFPPLENSKNPKWTLSAMLADVLRGLHYMHENGVAHLSLNPTNIFFKQNSGFLLTDFGSLFCTKEQVLHGDNGKPWYGVPPHVLDDLQGPNSFGSSLDVFCVGLLAASVEPRVLHEGWDKFLNLNDNSGLDVTWITDEMTKKLKDKHKPLLNFATKALNLNASILDLMKHPFLVDDMRPDDFSVIVPHFFTKAELDGVVHKEFRCRDESRLFDVLGQDPTESTALSSMYIESCNFGAYMDGDESQSNGNFVSKTHLISQPMTDPEGSIRMPFEGKILCGLCRVELSIVLFKCSVCLTYVRCGKCSVTDRHKKGHVLEPYLIHTIEHSDSGKEVVLTPPTSINDKHALEELEMQANLPVGALTKFNAYGTANNHVGNISKIDVDANGGASSRSSIVKNFDGSRVGSVSVATASSSNSDVASLFKSNLTSAFRMNNGGKGGLGLGGVSGGSGGGGIGGMTSNALKSKCKKLPKFSDMDESTWQDELRSCREKRSSELLLYRLDLPTVPKELFEPPPVHVVHLDLSYNNLKSLPHQISFLSNLRSISISNNHLVELPDTLGDLSDLEKLDLSHNNLTELPSTFTYLHRLCTISMDYNDFDRIPDCLLDLAASTLDAPILSAIYLAENPRIATFPKLENLTLLPTLTLALNNEPTVYKTYLDEKIEEEYPNVKLLWNKIYPDLIIDNLYCGSLRSAQSQVIYQKLNIKSLLTVGRDLVPVPPDGGRHLTVFVDDIEGADIERTFSEAVNFIDDSIKRNEGCLVHCFAGMSRSATTVIAYLMMKKGMRLDEAYCITKRGRPAIYPNHGFLQQLVSLDKQLFPNSRPLDIASMEREKVPMA